MMHDSESLLALIAFSFVISVTPGPNNLLLLSSGLYFGLRRTGWHMLGILWGTYLMICLVGVGLGALLAAVPAVQITLKLAGSIYMLCLARQFWRAGASQAGHVLRPIRFGEAVLYQLANPKVWLIATTVIAGFVPAGGQYLESVLATALVFCLTALPGIGIWAASGATLLAWIKDPAGVRRINRGMAVLTAAAAPLLWL